MASVTVARQVCGCLTPPASCTIQPTTIIVRMIITKRMTDRFCIDLAPFR